MVTRHSFSLAATEGLLIADATNWARGGEEKGFFHDVRDEEKAKHSDTQCEE